MAIDLSVTDANEGGSEKPNNPRHLLLLPAEMRSHAEALGGLVVVWSALEFQLSMLLAFMLDMEFTPKGDVITGHIEMKLRLKILHSLGHVVGKDLPNNWLVRLTDLTKKVEHDLSSRRNRMIHDVWSPTDADGVMTRIDMKPRILKATLELTMNRIQVSVADIQALNYEVYAAARQALQLTVELRPSWQGKSQ